MSDWPAAFYSNVSESGWGSPPIQPAQPAQLVNPAQPVQPVQHGTPAQPAQHAPPVPPAREYVEQNTPAGAGRAKQWHQETKSARHMIQHQRKKPRDEANTPAVPWYLGKVKGFEFPTLSHIVENFLMGVTEASRTLFLFANVTKRKCRLEACKPASIYPYSCECYMSGRYFKPGSGETEEAAQNAAAENALVACLEFQEQDGMSRLSEWRSRAKSLTNELQMRRRKFMKVMDPPGDVQPWSTSKVVQTELPSLVASIDRASLEVMEKIKQLTKHPWQILEEYSKANKLEIDCKLEVESEGPPHKTWRATACLGGDELASAIRKTRKDAKKAAAIETIRVFCPEPQVEMLEYTLAVEEAIERRKLHNQLSSDRYSQGSQWMTGTDNVVSQEPPEQPETAVNAALDIEQQRQINIPCQLEKLLGRCDRSQCVFEHNKPRPAESSLAIDNASEPPAKLLRIDASVEDSPVSGQVQVESHEKFRSESPLSKVEGDTGRGSFVSPLNRPSHPSASSTASSQWPENTFSDGATNIFGDRRLVFGFALDSASKVIGTKSSIGTNPESSSTTDTDPFYYSPVTKSMRSLDDILILFSCWRDPTALKVRPPDQPHFHPNFPMYDAAIKFEEDFLRQQDALLSAPSKDIPAVGQAKERSRVAVKQMRYKQYKQRKLLKGPFKLTPAIFDVTAKATSQNLYPSQILGDLELLLSSPISAPWSETSNYRNISDPLDTKVFGFSEMRKTLNTICSS